VLRAWQTTSIEDAVRNIRCSPLFAQYSEPGFFQAMRFSNTWTSRRLSVNLHVSERAGRSGCRRLSVNLHVSERAGRYGCISF